MILYEDLRWDIVQRKPVGFQSPAREATLVVVDMQWFFPAANRQGTIDNVAQLLQAAFARRWAIVFLEHQGWGHTLPQLMSVVEEAGASALDLCSIRTKRIWDGSSEVESMVQSWNCPCRQFYVCGVNAHECVQETVNGLNKRFAASRIGVVTDACNCETGLPWSQFENAELLELNQVAGKVPA